MGEEKHENLELQRLYAALKHTGTPADLDDLVQKILDFRKLGIKEVGTESKNEEQQ